MEQKTFFILILLLNQAAPVPVPWMPPGHRSLLNSRTRALATYLKHSFPFSTLEQKVIDDEKNAILVPIKISKNTSLATKGALAPRMQRSTNCKIQIGHQGAPKWLTGIFGSPIQTGILWEKVLTGKGEQWKMEKQDLVFRVKLQLKLNLS